MNPQWQDIALLGYIAIFGILTAVLILKEERLGWAMFAVKMSYAVAFGYGALMLAMPKLASEDVRRGIRILLAVSITWAIYELVSLRVRRWREARRERALS